MVLGRWVEDRVSRWIILTNVFKPVTTMFSISTVTLMRASWMNGSYVEIAFIDRSEISWVISASFDF